MQQRTLNQILMASEIVLYFVWSIVGALSYTTPNDYILGVCMVLLIINPFIIIGSYFEKSKIYQEIIKTAAGLSCFISLVFLATSDLNFHREDEIKKCFPIVSKEEFLKNAKDSAQPNATNNQK